MIRPSNLRGRSIDPGQGLSKRQGLAAALALGLLISIAPGAAPREAQAQAPGQAHAAGAPGAVAQAGSERRFDIAPQPLASALLAFRQQSGLQIAYRTDDVRGLTTQGVTGAATPEAALQRLLAGTGLGYEMSAANTVTLRRSVARPESGPLLLDRLTVTARRTEELVEDVPGSVFVLPGVDLERSNVTDLEGLNLRTPNLNLAEGTDRISANISIRGVSDQTGTQTTGPVVGVYVDEVLLNPTGVSYAIDPNLLDLERVEVLYGPQGTSFGRGTIGGAVNYVTRKPTEDFQAELTGEAGSFPDGLGRLIVNGSLTGDRRLMGRLVAFGRADDGFIETPTIGGSIDSHDYGARLSLRSQPTDRLTLDLSGSFDRTRSAAINAATIDTIDGDGDLEFRIDQAGRIENDRVLISFRGDYAFDAGTLISSTSFNDSRTRDGDDFDFSELDFITGFSERDLSSIGQEIRFEAAPFEAAALGEVTVLLGASATWSEDDVAVSLRAGSLTGQPPGTPFPGIAFTRDVFDVGLFGELRARPIPQLEVTVGGRFTFNEIEASQDGFESVSETFTNVSPKISVLYDWADDLSTYALVSTGFRSGGFNALGDGPLAGRSFDNERALNAEIGFKSRWFDDLLFLNASGFALFYRDLQVSEVQPVGLQNIVTLDNAASARSVGAELQAIARPIDGLELNVGYGFSAAKFTEYTDSPEGDLTGERLPSAPRHTLSLIGDYAHPVLGDSADAFVRAEYSYTSSREQTLNPFVDSFDAFDVLNLRLGLRADRFEVEAFAENVLDERYIIGTVGSVAVRDAFGVAEPFEVGSTRRFGVRATLRF